MSSARAFDSLRRLVLELLRPTLFLGSYRYRVVDVSAPGVLDLQRAPVKPNPDRSDPLGLPDIARCAAWTGIPGGAGDSALGSFVLVRFIDGDETQPYIEAFEGESTPGYLPTRAALDASGNTVIGASSPNASIGKTGTVPGARVIVGGKEPADAAVSQDRFVKYGDIMINTGVAGPMPIVMDPSCPTMSTAGAA